MQSVYKDVRPYRGKDELINPIKNAWGKKEKKKTLSGLAATITDRLIKVIDKKRCIYGILTLYFYLILIDFMLISMTNIHQFSKLSFIVILYFIYVHNLCFCIVISMLRMRDIKILEFN